MRFRRCPRGRASSWPRRRRSGGPGKYRGTCQRQDPASRPAHVRSPSGGRGEAAAAVQQSLLVTPPIDEVLRDRGLRATPQRLAVHRAVAESSGHPDAEEIWAAVRTELPNISLRTVYEVLH